MSSIIPSGFNKLILIFIVFALSTSSCNLKGDKSSDLPKGILEKEKLINILADIQITESYLDDLRKSAVRTTDTSLLYYEKVFKKYDCSPEEFEKSLLFYKKDLEDMGQIYTDVITRLNELGAKNEEMLLQMKLDSIREDSIKQAQFMIDSLIESGDSTILFHDSLKEINDSIFVHENYNKKT